MRSASYRNEMELLHIVELWRNNASSSGFYEARLRRMKHFAALAAKYEAPLVSGMKQSLDRLR